MRLTASIVGNECERISKIRGGQFAPESIDVGLNSRILNRGRSLADLLREQGAQRRFFRISCVLIITAPPPPRNKNIYPF